MNNGGQFHQLIITISLPLQSSGGSVGFDQSSQCVCVCGSGHREENTQKTCPKPAQSVGLYLALGRCARKSVIAVSSSLRVAIAAFFKSGLCRMNEY